MEVQQKAADFKQLVMDCVRSPEFVDRLTHHNSPRDEGALSLPSVVNRANIDVNATEEELDQCALKIKTTWEYLGAEKAHWSVLATDTFLPDKLHESIDSFWASGQAEADLATDDARKIGWLDTNEHASGLSILNKRNICDPAIFSQRVKFQFCDMNHIPAEFDEQFDFVWSACALEHLGSIKLGQEFVYNSIKCLKPGGIAVHTTEYNISSKTDTVDNGGTVIFRQCDIQEIIDTLRSQGHLIEMDWDEGDGPADKFIDVAPYCDDPHLKLKLWQYTTTSIGLIIKKGV